VEVDVAIIGAGPAGATLAALLARRGVAVALYDRDAFPRDKLCGEFLSYDALPVLDPLGVVDAIDAAGAPRITRGRIVARHATYDFALPHAARGVSRLFFDDLLVRTAAASGARIHTETVSELPRAKVVVGAWGRWGRFDQQLRRSFVHVKDRNFGFKRHYRGTHARDTIELHSFARGYLGVNAVEAGLTNICGLVHASRLAGHKGGWPAFVDGIRAEERTLQALFAAHTPAQEHFLASEPVIFRARSAVEGGVFLVGDASGVIDPLTGNGMAMAVQSALLAAPLLLRLVETPAQRAAIETEYRTRHHRFFAARIAWSRRAATLLSRPALLDAALFALRGSGIAELFLRRTRGSRDEVARLTAAWFC
jgi:flavin-dependent dehydrogenase